MRTPYLRALSLFCAALVAGFARAFSGRGDPVGEQRQLAGALDLASEAALVASAQSCP